MILLYYMHVATPRVYKESKGWTLGYTGSYTYLGVILYLLMMATNTCQMQWGLFSIISLINSYIIV